MLRMRLELFWRTKIFNQMIWIKHEFLQKNAQKRFLNDHLYDLTVGILYKLKFVKNGGTPQKI